MTWFKQFKQRVVRFARPVAKKKYFGALVLIFAAVVTAPFTWMQAVRPSKTGPNGIPRVIDPVPNELVLEIEALVKAEDIGAVRKMLKDNPENRTLHRCFILKGIELEVESIVLCVRDTVPFPFLQKGEWKFRDLERYQFLAKRKGLLQATDYLERHLAFHESVDLRKMASKKRKYRDQFLQMLRKYDSKPLENEPSFWHSVFRNLSNDEECKAWVARIKPMPDLYRKYNVQAALAEVGERKDISPESWFTLLDDPTFAPSIEKQVNIFNSKFWNNMFRDLDSSKACRKWAARISRMHPTCRGRIAQEALKQLRHREDLDAQAWQALVRELPAESLDEELFALVSRHSTDAMKEYLTDAAIRARVIEFLREGIPQTEGLETLFVLIEPEEQGRLVQYFSEKSHASAIRWCMKHSPEEITPGPKNSSAALLLGFRNKNLEQIRDFIASTPRQKWSSPLFGRWWETIQIRGIGERKSSIVTQAAIEWPAGVVGILELLEAERYKCADIALTALLIGYEREDKELIANMLGYFDKAERVRNLKLSEEIIEYISRREPDLQAFLSENVGVAKAFARKTPTCIAIAIKKDSHDLLSAYLRNFHAHQTERVLDDTRTVLLRAIGNKVSEQILMSAMSHPRIFERLLAEGLQVQPQHWEFAVLSGNSVALELMLRDLSSLPQKTYPGLFHRRVDVEFVSSLFEKAAASNNPETVELLESFGLRKYTQAPVGVLLNK